MQAEFRFCYSMLWRFFFFFSFFFCHFKTASPIDFIIDVLMCVRYDNPSLILTTDQLSYYCRKSWSNKFIYQGLSPEEAAKYALGQFLVSFEMSSFVFFFFFLRCLCLFIR
jgi:hypothetical protein